MTKYYNDSYEEQVGIHFLSYLINNDDSGISEEDKKLADKWVKETHDYLINEEDAHHWHLSARTEEDGYFGRCGICDLRSTVADVDVVFFVLKEK